MQALARKTKTRKPAISGITGIRVSGFKSIDKEQSIEIRPLTILAGANSSGKSSIMQPLLLLKQTIESPYDPGPLLLDGENVRFSRTTDFLSRTRSSESARRFSVAIQHGAGMETELLFADCDDHGLDVERTTLLKHGEAHTVRRDMNQSEISEFLRLEGLDIAEKYHRELLGRTSRSDIPPKWEAVRRRCFLELALTAPSLDRLTGFRVTLTDLVAQLILRLTHVPGLRTPTERTYRTTAAGDQFPGLFDNYVARLIYEWQTYVQDPRLEELALALERLGLTSQIRAEHVDDTHIRLEVARVLGRSKRDDQDFVSIADVGVGVSQVVPVLVALLVASEGQLVYIEQPEIHLHPRAQTALAEIIAEAAKRGVIVVIETHSPLLILALQSLVAEGKLDPRLAKLHWFKRIRGGSTRVSSANLDDAGAFGDWPEDFADVTLDLEQRYIDAAFNAKSP